MFDVVVIGAGLSGLQAALSAQQAGLTVAVIEARDRIGGKVWSVPTASGKGMADLGAAWVNIYTQKRMAAYVEKFKLELQAQRLVGKAVMQESSSVRSEFPFGIMPDVSRIVSEVLDCTDCGSLRQRRRKTLSVSAIISKPSLSSQNHRKQKTTK